MRSDRSPRRENLRPLLGQRPSPNHLMLKDSREQALLKAATAWSLSPGSSTCTICVIAKPLLKSKGKRQEAMLSILDSMLVTTS